MRAEGQNEVDTVSFVVWLVTGAAAGFLASIVARTKYGGSLDVLVGMIGAVIGGLIFNKLGSITSFNVWGLIVSFITAVILLGLQRLGTE